MYLDPGFGSMVIQLVIGGVAAMGAGFYLFREKIKTFFGIRSNEKPAAEENEVDGGGG